MGVPRGTRARRAAGIALLARVAARPRDGMGHVSPRRGVLARGPWRPDQVEAVWREDAYTVPAQRERMADGAVESLRERGSPAHDGMATRLVAWDARADHLRLELQPVRWALRLLDDASDSMTALCVVRSEDGRWLAGRPAGRGGGVGGGAGAGGRPAAPTGCRAGRAGGRSARAAPSTSARARPRRSRASFRRS